MTDFLQNIQDSMFGESGQNTIQHYKKPLFVTMDESESEGYNECKSQTEESKEHISGGPQLDEGETGVICEEDEYEPVSVFSNTDADCWEKERSCDEYKNRTEEEWNWCFLCTYSPISDECGQFQTIKDILDYDMTLALKVQLVQKHYNNEFKSICEGRWWSLYSIANHCTKHGGFSNQAKKKELERAAFGLIVKILQEKCLQRNKSTNKVELNNEGVASFFNYSKMYIKIFSETQSK